VNAPLWSQPIREQAAAAESVPRAASDLVHQTRTQIQAREPELKAWVALSSDIAAEAALLDQTEATLPLRGISMAVKDLIDVKGLPTRAGSSITSPTPATKDADCVARLRSLGAVVQGKTVTTEFGYFAPGPTTNPRVPGHTPGGSSSGSAAAVGSGTIPLALGTQTAGSLTRPASYCGAAGMVLAKGSTSMSGIIGLSESLDTLGLLTRSVDDLRTVYRALQDPDAVTSRSNGDITVFIWHGSELGVVTPPMRELIQRLPQLIDDLEIECRPLDWDDQVWTLATDHGVVMAHEAAGARSAELRWHANALSLPLRQLLEEGGQIPKADHRAALMRRDRSLELLTGLLNGKGVVIGPAALGPAPKGLAATGSPILSRPWQLLGLPVVVVPGAVTTTGLPLGLQIVGLPGREGDMLDLGTELENLVRGMPHLTDQPEIRP
jgi:Asp-tRNA(Asn)/Glu-tRNA(Gln) amidotransferase A subunit family amidase